MRVWLARAVHNLHPFTRISVMFALTYLCRLFLDPRLGAPLLLLSLILAYMTDIPKRLLKLIAGMLVFGSGVSLINSFFFVSTQYYKVIPPAIAGKVVLLSPELPVFGQIGITYGSLIYWVSGLIRTPTALLFGYVLIHSVSANEFMSALAKAKVPSQILFTLALMVQYFSMFREIVAYTMNAQKLRGWRVKSRNPFKACFSYIPMSRRIALRLINTVDKVTIVSRSRGFAVHPPRDYSINIQNIEFRKLDLLIIIFSLIVVLSSVYMLVVHNFGMI